MAVGFNTINKNIEIFVLLTNIQKINFKISTFDFVFFVLFSFS